MYEHVWTYFVYDYTLMSPRLLRTSFFGSCYLELRNALENEKIAKLVFIFKCMRSSS